MQVNKSKSKQNALRGLHFQKPPHNQAKIINVTKGVILDVIVDIRTDSSTFGQHQRFVLDNKEMLQLYVPRGFAHGFVVLSKNAVFQYIVDNEYAPEYDTGIKYDDVTLNIDWGLNRFVVSDKDKKLKLFKKQDFFTKTEYFRK
jgi:dTDP-4-dehydrorhamnose 3,5-epimerase